jgi:hypothetical protein
MISIAAMYGTESVLFVNDVFWDSAITRSSGRRIFSDAEIPEEWQVKQYISQMSTLVKAKSKAVAGVEMLSPEDKLLQLNTYISEIPGLSVETNLLSTAILSLGVELSYIKQKDIRVKVKELGVSSTIMMRGIVEACKKVGKPVTNIIRPQRMESTDSQLITEEDLQPAEESLLQDEFDAERNNDDLDDEHRDLENETEE